jgi:hypothetical protein
MDRIYNSIDFTGIAIGSTQTLAHGLILRGVRVVPDLILLQFPTVFELVSADATNVTIRNTADITGDCVAQVSAIHPTIRLLGGPPDDGSMGQGLTPRPFCPGSPNSGGDGGSSEFDVVVFRPGGVASGNVVTTWAAALSALSALEGTRYLQFDDVNTSPIVIPVGGPYDMTGVIWSTIPDRIVQVSVPEGVTFTKLRAFQDRIAVTFSGTTAPVSDFSSPAPQIDTVSFSDNAQIITSGAGPFFAVSDNAQFNLGTAGAILTGTHEVINIAVNDATMDDTMTARRLLRAETEDRRDTGRSVSSTPRQRASDSATARYPIYPGVCSTHPVPRPPGVFHAGTATAITSARDRSASFEPRPAAYRTA